LLSAPAHPPTPLSSHHYTAPSTRPRLAPLTVGGRADVVSAVIARVVGALSAVRERGGAGRRVRQRTQEAIEEEHLRPTVGNAFGSGPSACAHDKSLSFLTMVSLRKKRSAIFFTPFTTNFAFYCRAHRRTGVGRTKARGEAEPRRTSSPWCWVATFRPPCNMIMQQ